MFSLDVDNYYTPEANQAYWSASFVKSMLQCPARAIAELNGEYSRPATSALLIGSYVDAYFEGSIEKFKSEHPEIMKRDGTLKSEFRLANNMISRAEEDELFCEFMQGEKQVIKTGQIGGLPFKCKIDVYRPGERIVDLKTVKDMQPMYKPEQGKLSFVEYWNWSLQMAIYQAIEGNSLPCYLAVITKQEPSDIAVIEIPQAILDAEMEVLLSKLPYFDAMRQGVIEPERCGECEYCRATHKLDKPTNLYEIIEI
ncbi:MAG: PD-(D/E)XK nuclease-like domain-containing protein [Acutalibacteraceae bacterium]